MRMHTEVGTVVHELLLDGGPWAWEVGRGSDLEEEDLDGSNHGDAREEGTDEGRVEVVVRMLGGDGDVAVGDNSARQIVVGEQEVLFPSSVGDGTGTPNAVGC